MSLLEINNTYLTPAVKSIHSKSGKGNQPTERNFLGMPNTLTLLFLFIPDLE